MAQRLVIGLIPKAWVIGSCHGNDVVYVGCGRCSSDALALHTQGMLLQIPRSVLLPAPSIATASGTTSALVRRLMLLYTMTLAVALPAFDQYGAMRPRTGFARGMGHAAPSLRRDRVR